MVTKLVFIFVFVIIIPISIISYISYNNYAKSIQRNTSAYTLQASEEMLARVDDYITDMETLTILPMFSFTLFHNSGFALQDLLQDQEVNINKTRQIDFYLSQLNNMKKGINTIYIISDLGELYYVNNMDSIRKDMDQKVLEWRQKARLANGDPVLISTQQINPNRSSPTYVFTVLREIKDVNRFESIGAIIIDVDIDVISNFVSKLDKVTKGKTIIVDKDNQVIYDSNHSLVTHNISGNSLIQPANKSRGSYYTEIDGESYLTAYSESENTGWRVFVYVPQKELLNDVWVIRNYTFLASLFIGSIALTLSILFAVAITRPLKKLIHLMRRVQDGNLDVTFKVKGHDEIGVLGFNFNQMLSQIKQLISKVYISDFRKKEAELIALQSQINPHFIYNTLETIRMRAIINDDLEVSNMTFSLGKLLRYSITRSGEIVNVQEELVHLGNYIKLQNYRFNNRFKLVNHIADELLNFQMIKLIFQPIVENAITHGIDRKQGSGEIVLSSEIGEDTIRFFIDDNGVGMEQEHLEQLILSFHTQFEEDKPAIGGIGLRNVHERIKLHYGEQYGLHIESKVGAGTRIIIRLPRDAD